MNIVQQLEFNAETKKRDSFEARLGTSGLRVRIYGFVDLTLTTVAGFAVVRTVAAAGAAAVLSL